MPEEAPPAKKGNVLLWLVLGKRPWWTLARVCLWVVASFVLFKIVLLPIRIKGESMSPTLANDSVHFINRLAYTWTQPQRTDIVGVEIPEHRLFLIKRIVGMPGERVSIHNGSIYIDGTELSEPYLVQRTPYRMREIKLRAREYFVIGDNRMVSENRRVFEGDIAGRLLFPPKTKY